jgi:hypothetical protein
MSATKVIFASGLFTFGALCANGCGAPQPREELPIDCTATDRYGTPDLIPDTWFSATDGTGAVLCDSLEVLLPADMTDRLVAKQLDPLKITPAQCKHRVLCSDPNAILPDPLPQEALDRLFCESSAPDKPEQSRCDSLVALLPLDVTDEQFAALMDPLLVQPAGLQCNPRVLCSDPYAIVPDLLPPEQLFCESTYARRAEAAYASETLPETERCSADPALHLTAARNNDWGCLFGNYGLATQTQDKSAYDGVGLWAKAAPGTTKTITIILNDKYSTNIKQDNVPVAGTESACVDEEGSGDQGTTVNQATGQTGSTSVAVPGYVPSENACGNAYQGQLAVSDDWQFYFLPFESFTQDPKPNRRLEGIDRTSLRGITIRAPKAAVLDLRIAGLGYYHKVD